LEAPGGTASGSGTAVAATPTTLATRPGAIVTTSPDVEEEAAPAAFVSPQPNPVKRGRAYTVPNTPFILDPLL
jgi:hypothetical protein